MTKLKPQLIVAGPSKKKGGFASGIGYFLVLAIVFVLGVYVGMGITNSDFEGGQLIGMTQDATSTSPSTITESNEETKVIKQQVNTKAAAPAALEDTKNLANTVDVSNSEATSVGNNLGSEQAIVISSVDDTAVSFNNGSAVLDTNSLDEVLFDQDTYRLQVAAFGSIDQANEVANDLRLRGYDAYIVTTSNSRGEVWNLIKVGKFNTAKEAWNYSTIFQSKEGGEVFVESLSKGRVYNESFEENSDTL